MTKREMEALNKEAASMATDIMLKCQEVSYIYDELTDQQADKLQAYIEGKVRGKIREVQMRERNQDD